MEKCEGASLAGWAAAFPWVLLLSNAERDTLENKHPYVSSLPWPMVVKRSTRNSFKCVPQDALVPVNGPLGPVDLLDSHDILNGEL